MNKVKFNLKNVHYAKLTVGDGGTPTYAAPVPIPGAVSLSQSPEGDSTPFYADGRVYYRATANNGYSGDLEIAMVPDSFRTDILGEKEDESNKILVENANAEPSPFALLFEFDGDEKAIRHVMYNCSATRPNLEAQTTTESKEVATDTMAIAAYPLEDGTVRAKTTADTPESVYNNWFKSVLLPGPQAGA